MKFTAVFCILLSASAFAEKWDETNDPRNFDENYQYLLSALPTKASLPLNKTPWQSSYWPRKNGSVNYRWNSANPTGYNLNSPSRARLQSMSIEELKELSPAEKFDLVQGHYDYPFSKMVEWGSTPKAKNYEGVCDGWTASSIEFAEPAPVEIKNPDGIVIPFGSSDVKALMSYDVSINEEAGALGPVFIGGYCATPGGMRLGTSRCRDINPGAFHVVLANQIGLLKQSFGVDVDPGKETWNQPVYAFEFEIKGATTPSQGAASSYIVHAKMMYAEDDPEEQERRKYIFSYQPTVGTANYLASTMEVDYVLDLDYSGRIIGGNWLGESRSRHPDLFWKATNKIVWTKEFEILNKIYKPFFVE
jgi:Transglutaminase elicitor